MTCSRILLSFYYHIILLFYHSINLLLYNSSIQLFYYSLILFYILFSILSTVIEEKEKDEISSPSSLVAFEEEEISSSRQPTLSRHHTVGDRLRRSYPTHRRHPARHALPHHHC